MEKTASKVVQKEIRLTPPKIVLLYALIGGLWILFSDRMLALMVTDPQLITRIQTYKGWFFVAATAFLLYGLISRYFSEIQKSAESLRRGEESFRTLAENAQDMIYRMSLPDGRYEYVSPASGEIFGYSPEEFYESPILIQKAIHPEWHEYFKEQWDNLLSGVMPPFYEYQIIHKSGEVRWLHQRNVLVRDDRGEPAVIEGVVTDITGRKTAEKALLEKEHLLSESQRIAHIGSWTYDLAGHITWSDETYRIYGVSPDTFVPSAETFPELIHPDDRTSMQAWIISCLAGEKRGDLEFRTILPDGAVRFISGRGELAYNAANRPAYMAGTAQDITERKQAEERISRLTWLYSVLSKINEAIVRTKEPEELYRQACRIIVEDGGFRMAWIGIVDPDTLLVNPVVVRGHEDGYLTEKRISIDERIPEGRGPTGTAIRKEGYFICNDIENDPAMLPWREEALKRGYCSSAAFALKSGTQVIGTLNIYSSVAYFFQEEEEVRLLKALAEDISNAIESIEIEKQRIKAEEELQELTITLESRVKERTAALQDSQLALMNIVDDLNNKTEELEQANIKLKDLDRLKSMFIASMSHELRTPLNSIIGFSSILHDGWIGPLNAEQKENLATILRSGKHLLSLINDVIDVSKIESGKIEISYADFDIYDVISEAVELFKKDVQDKGLELQVELIHHIMHTDRRRLLQCVVNLISNAVKFTEKGSVRVSIRRVRSRELGVTDKESSG